MRNKILLQRYKAAKLTDRANYQLASLGDHCTEPLSSPTPSFGFAAEGRLGPFLLFSQLGKHVTTGGKLSSNILAGRG